MIRTSIVLADDHTVVRCGLKALIEREPDFDVIGEAGTGTQALQLIEQLRPRVAVIDLIMPGINGLEVACNVRERALGTRVVILSMYSNESYVVQAFKNGCLAYVVKDSSEADLIHAIKEADAGRRYLSPSLSMPPHEFVATSAEPRSLDPYEILSAREREVLKLCADGESAPRIAERLQISPRTVESHRANLMHKLGLRNQAELIRYAVRRGIGTAE